MNKFSTFLLIWALTFIPLSNQLFAEEKEGTVANFTLRDMEGKTFNLTDHLGQKIILINFWATWCIPCQQEFPHLEKLNKKYNADELLILAITVDNASSISRVKPFIKGRHYSFTVLLDTESQVINRFNPKIALPFTLIIDQHKSVVFQHEGYKTGDELEVEKVVTELLKKEIKS